jgi:hypothetical protein
MHLSTIKYIFRGNASHKPDSFMSLSTDIIATRRAISAPRIRSNYRGIFDLNKGQII